MSSPKWVKVAVGDRPTGEREKELTIPNLWLSGGPPLYILGVGLL